MTAVIKPLSPNRVIPTPELCLPKVPEHPGQAVRRIAHLWIILKFHKSLALGSLFFSTLHAEYPHAIDSSFTLNKTIKQMTHIPGRLSWGCFLIAPYASGTRARQRWPISVKTRSGLRVGCCKNLHKMSSLLQEAKGMLEVWHKLGTGTERYEMASQRKIR